MLPGGQTVAPYLPPYARHLVQATAADHALR
jgi:hypothetical protein